MAEEEQRNNFIFSPNIVNNVDDRLEDVHEPKNDNVVGVELDLIVVKSGRGRGSCGRGRACGVKQKRGHGNKVLAEGSTSGQSSGGRLTSYV